MTPINDTEHQTPMNIAEIYETKKTSLRMQISLSAFTEAANYLIERGYRLDDPNFFIHIKSQCERWILNGAAEPKT